MRIPPQNPAPQVIPGAPATPFVDQMPELVAHLEAPHGPDDWRARTQSGEEVLARRLTVPESERTTLLDRLRWLWEAEGTGLLPLRGAATNADGVWLLLRPVPGSPLGAISAGEPLTPAETVATGRSLFRGLATLHRIGLGQLVVPRTILVDAEGKARLDGPWLPVDPAERAGQVRALGEALAQALGIPVRPGEELTDAERQAPGLVATLRGIAGGTAIDAATAGALLEEAAGALGAPPQVARSEKGLAERVKQLLAPGAEAGSRRPGARVRRVPVPPAGGPATSRTASAPPVRIGPRMSEKTAWNAKPSPRRAAAGRVRAGSVLAAALIGLVLLVLVFSAATIINGRNRQVAATPPPSATPTPVPTAPPSLAPPSAAPISSVALTTDQVGSCSPGQPCQVQVKVSFSSGSHSAAWNFYVTNVCTGKVTQVGSGGEDAPYPAYVYADSTVTIPSGNSLQLVAKTTSPAVAASSPVKIGSGTC